MPVPFSVTVAPTAPGEVTEIVKGTGVTLPLAVGAKVIAIGGALFPGDSGPKLPPVTVKGGVEIDCQLPLRVPLPLFLMVRFLLAVVPALAVSVTVVGNDNLPGKPAPLSVTVRLLLPKESLLVIVAVAELASIVGEKVISSF